MEVIYLLSDILDYGQLLCDDAGPGYCNNMGWQHVYLRDTDLLLSEKNRTIVIDNRIQPGEIEKINCLIQTNPKSLFFLKIVDPYFENCTGNFYYSFVEQSSHYNNAVLFSVYEPKEITLKIKNKFGDRFIHLPYPYLKAKEIDVNISKKNKIIISGALNSNIYPYRYSIWKKTTRSLFRFLFKILKHPGYLDMNGENNFMHTLIKDQYIKYLSGYRYMLVCPSRCRIEFLKYNECGYAGSIPVGLPPSSYPLEIQDLFIKLDSDSFITNLFNIFFIRKNDLIVNRLRSFLHTTRNPEVLNKQLSNFISEFSNAG